MIAVRNIHTASVGLAVAFTNKMQEQSVASDIEMFLLKRGFVAEVVVEND